MAGGKGWKMNQGMLCPSGGHESVCKLHANELQTPLKLSKGESFEDWYCLPQVGASGRKRLGLLHQEALSLIVKTSA